jgi:site-specific DNA-methyltransferase (adenine-specific)
VPKKKNGGRLQRPRKLKPPYRTKPAEVPPPEAGGPPQVAAVRKDRNRVQRHAARRQTGGHPQGSHFQLHEDGTIQATPSRHGGGHPQGLQRPPVLTFRDDAHGLWLYHGNCLELLDAIYAKYGDDGRFDMIFADPPYFLSNGGITCHAGKMVKVDKGDWDQSRGAELNHEFNTEWLRRCQRVLKPNGTIWVSGTHHVIFSIGFAMQQLGYKILNDIAWEKPNPPPNLSCRYFTHSTETILWAAKDEKSKHTFNYQEMRKVTGKQMKTVWREVGSPRTEEGEIQVGSSRPGRHSGTRDGDCDDRGGSPQVGGSPQGPQNSEILASSASWRLDPIWTLPAPGNGEKTHGKHPTQKPVALIERCLLASTNEGDLVLDPFLGGGTTAIAALKLKRQCVGIELDFSHLALAMKRSEREIIEIALRSLRVRIEVSVFSQNDLDQFSDSINGSRAMDDKPQVPTERIFHECKFVFLSCAQVERGSVVHTTVDVSLQEAWAKTPNGKKRETTHVVRCETEIFRVKSS